MKTKSSQLLVLAALVFASIFSCKKIESSKDDNKAPSAATISATGAISISGIISSGTTAPGDSLYLVGCFSGSIKKDSVAFANLVNPITTYLNTNYAGYVFKKAFKIADKAGTVTAYVILIKVNDKPVGLKFDASGNFLNVLEQREGRDLIGKGWHLGGRFDHRDGQHRDTLALSALPALVKSAFNASYATDTLLHAQITKDTVYVLISKNNGLFATAISAKGTVLKRTTIDNARFTRTAVLQADLPTSISNYFSTTYPGFVFDKAFSLKRVTTSEGYVVFVTVNSTKYAFKFNSSGAFVGFIIVR